MNIAYNMDCMEFMKSLPDNAFDLAVVDPPYGRKEHGGKRRSGFVKQKNGVRTWVPDGQYAKKDWDEKPADSAYFKELFRVSKNQIIWGINYFKILVPPGRIIWDKCNGLSDQCDCEIAFNSFGNRVDLFRFMWSGMMQGKSISSGHIMQGNKKLNEKRIHPTQKPVALYSWIFNRYAKPGDKILDTHLGSGSSRIAAYDAGLDFVGCEIDQEYFDKQEKRFLDYTAQENLFLMENSGAKQINIQEELIP